MNGAPAPAAAARMHGGDVPNAHDAHSAIRGRDLRPRCPVTDRVLPRAAWAPSGRTAGRGRDARPVGGY